MATAQNRPQDKSGYDPGATPEMKGHVAQLNQQTPGNCRIAPLPSTPRPVKEFRRWKDATFSVRRPAAPSKKQRRQIDKAKETQEGPLRRMQRLWSHVGPQRSRVSREKNIRFRARSRRRHRPLGRKRRLSVDARSILPLGVEVQRGEIAGAPTTGRHLRRPINGFRQLGCDFGKLAVAS